MKLTPGRVTDVPLRQLKPDPANPRAAIDQDQLAGLVASVKELGILQPLTVRRDGKQLVVVTGHRRLAAAKAAGLKAVPCLLDTADRDAVERGIAQVAENTARQSLSQMDVARFLRSLRDQRLSMNEIMAKVAGAGLKALKKQQIENLIAVTSLPQWATAMIDAGQAEPGDMLAVREVAGTKLEPVARKGIEQHIKWSGQAEGRDIKHVVRDALGSAYVDLGVTEAWQASPQRPVVLFDWKTRCKGCEHLKQFAGEAWCMSREGFDQHQAEAKEAGLGPGGRRPPKQSPAAREEAKQDAAQEKAEQREQSLAVKARQYLHNWLASSIQAELAAHGANWHELGNALVVWAALGKPGITSDWQRRGQRPSLEGLNHAIGEHPAARSVGINSIADVLARHLDESIDRAAYEASLEIVTSLTWGETLAVAKTIWTDLEAAWQLTNDTFLRLHRKAELAHLARTHGVPLPDGARSWDSMKTDQLVAELLKHPELLRRPAILVDLWNQEPLVSPDDPELLGDEDGGREEFEEAAA